MKEKWQSIRGFFRKNSRKLIPLLLLAAILLPIVVDNSYVLGICTKILLYMLLASSVNVINGYSGQFAIGHAGFLCVGAYTAAILMARANVSFFLAMLGAGVMTSLFGMLVSFPIGKLSGIYLGFVTLGFSEIVRIICLNWTSVTGGPMGIKAILLAVLARVLLYYLHLFGHYGFLHQPHSEIPHRACVDLHPRKRRSGSIHRYQYGAIQDDEHYVRHLLGRLCRCLYGNLLPLCGFLDVCYG